MGAWRQGVATAGVGVVLPPDAVRCSAHYMKGRGVGRGEIVNGPTLGMRVSGLPCALVSGCLCTCTIGVIRYGTVSYMRYCAGLRPAGRFWPFGLTAVCGCVCGHREDPLLVSGIQWFWDAGKCLTWEGLVVLVHR